MSAGVSDTVRLFPDLPATASYRIAWHKNLRVARRVQVVVELLDRIVREERSLFRSEP